MYVTAQNQCAACPVGFCCTRSRAYCAYLRFPQLHFTPRRGMNSVCAKGNNRGSPALRTATRRIKGPHHNPNVAVCKGTLNTLILQAEALEGSFCRISAPPIRTLLTPSATQVTMRQESRSLDAPAHQNSESISPEREFQPVQQSSQGPSDLIMQGVRKAVKLWQRRCICNSVELEPLNGDTGWWQVDFGFPWRRCLLVYAMRMTRSATRLHDLDRKQFIGLERHRQLHVLP